MEKKIRKINENMSIELKHTFYLRDCPRFWDQVGYRTTNASIGNKHFFSLNNNLVRLTKIMNNIVKDLKILNFKVNF